jgi:hypothetical protein
MMAGPGSAGAAGAASVAPRRRLRRAIALAAASWVIVLAVVRLVVAQPERCDALPPSQLRAAAGHAVDWFVRNQSDDGRWTYRYSADDDRLIDGYNLVRHAGVSLSLAQAAAADLPGAATSAAQGLRYALDHLIVPGPGLLAFGEPGAALDAGATALLVAALVEWRLTAAGAGGADGGTPLTVDEATLDGLGRFLVGQLDTDGAVAAFWMPGSGPLHERSRFFTGEVTWALVRLHRLDPTGPWREPAARALRYLVARRDTVEDWFPPIADHWGAYAVADAAGAPDLLEPLGGALDAFVVRQAGRFGPQVRYEASRTDSWFSTLTRGRTPLGAALGTVGEGLASLDRLVALAPERVPELASARARLAERVDCVAALLAKRQVDETEAGRYPRPGLVQGAWLAGGVTQMDDQQHALSAILGAVATGGEAAR